MAGQLSNFDAARLASALAQLSAANTPLEAGLEAMASDLPRGKLSRALRSLAEPLRRGVPWETALANPGCAIPAYLQAVIVGGLRRGDVPSTLARYVERQRAARGLRRQVKVSLAYPLLMVGLTAFLCVLLCQMVGASIMGLFDEEPGDMPYATQILFLISGVGRAEVWIGLACLAAACFALWRFKGYYLVRRLWNAIPILGPFWHWICLGQFCSLLADLLRQGVTLPEAVRLSGEGSDDADLAWACGEMRRRLEAGQSLSTCVARSMQFRVALVPMLVWGEQTSMIPAALEFCADLCDVQSESRLVAIRTVFPPLCFLVILVLVGFVASGVLMPLVHLVRHLT